MKIKEKKDSILLVIQNQLPLSYKQVEGLFEITNSYDAILEVNNIALKYNKDHIAVARYLFGH